MNVSQSCYLLLASGNDLQPCLYTVSVGLEIQSLIKRHYTEHCHYTGNAQYNTSTVFSLLTAVVNTHFNQALDNYEHRRLSKTTPQNSEDKTSTVLCMNDNHCYNTCMETVDLLQLHWPATDPLYSSVLKHYSLQSINGSLKLEIPACNLSKLT